MTIALELRWFWQGPVEADKSRWFSSASELLGESITRPDTRSDHYLLDPSSAEFGIKLRGGQLELKRLLESTAFEDSGTGVTGVAELWAKSLWPYNVTKDAEGHDVVVKAFEENVREARMLEVKKRRWERKYTVSADGDIKRVDLDSFVVTGFAVELTELQVAKATWSTLGVEVYDEPSKSGLLTTAVRWFFTHYRAPNLTLAESRSYPAWLSRIALDARNV